MAIIKTLKDFLTKATLYPITKTQAVYDDTVGRLDSYLRNTLGAEPIDDVNEESTDLIDADTLGGRYTAEDLDAMPKSTAIEDYANIEPPMVDADRLGGKYTANGIEQEFAKLNSSLTASDSLKFRFATDGEGNYGYLGADDSFIPFSSMEDVKECIATNKTSSDVTVPFTPTKTGVGKVYAVRGSSNTTINVLQGSATVFTKSLTTDTGILKNIGEISLVANTEYKLVLKGLSNTTTVATAFVIYI